MSDYNYRGGPTNRSEASAEHASSLANQSTPGQKNRAFKRKAMMVAANAMIGAIGNTVKGDVSMREQKERAANEQHGRDKSGWITSSAQGVHSASPEEPRHISYEDAMNASVMAGRKNVPMGMPGYAQQMDHSVALGAARKPLADEADDALKRSKANSAAEAGPVGGMYTRDGLAAVDETASSTARDLQTGYGGMRQGGMLSSLPRKMWTP